ncbi:Nif3-like dinuclear metal center hexameric protein, partial [Leuconostoc mesenteroides]|uniref:Nif3-like dinuclear metal center hexameric protein n=1 Tax=Leuconostoc mesenteroides TaxID=1245 RepID=UPI001CBB6C3D
DYTGTSFTSIGHGRFTPEAGAHPAIGKVGKTEQVQEAKVEVILPETIEKQVIQAMRSAHPYEEPAYDLFAIDEPVEMFGLGRVGELPQESSREACVEQVKEAYPLEGLRKVQAKNAKSSEKRIASRGESGEKFYKQARAERADGYI